MDIRSNESPMDFQWQKGHGPAGPDSPFLKAAANHHQNQNGFTGHKRESRNLRDAPHQEFERQQLMRKLAFSSIQPKSISYETFSTIPIPLHSFYEASFRVSQTLLHYAPRVDRNGLFLWARESVFPS